MPSLHRIALFGTAAACGLLLAPALASAQSASDADPIGSVIVTAERREANIQDVPIAVSAIGGDTLDAQAIVGFSTLTQRVPSLRFGAGVTGGEHVITLRGIGSQNTTSGGDSPVAYNLDGVYLARTTAVDPDFFDVERIEVLRGPQGTLYGRNSVGGSVNVITRRPTMEGGAHADVAFGNYDSTTVRGWVNAPLLDNGVQQVAARITAVHSEHDPYQENLFTGPGATHEADAGDFSMLRAGLFVRFSDDADLLLNASLMSNDAAAATKTQWYLAPGRYTGAAPFQTDPRRIYKDAPERFNQDGSFLSATFNYDFGGMTFTSVTGYAEGSWFQQTDADGSELPIAIGNYWTLDSDQWSQEFRLTSTNDASPLQWIVGLFYFNEEVLQSFQFTDTGLNSASPATDTFVFTNGGLYETTSWAPFGQIDYDFSKTSWGAPLTLTFGLRYTSDTKEGNDFLDFTLPLVPFALNLAKTFDQSWEEVTGRIGASYEFTDDFMAYASYSRGYLSGGGLVGNFPGIYQPETVDAYEIGFKSVSFNGRLQFNTAIYHQEIENMQVFVQDITGSRIDNAGLAHVTGAELEFVAVPVDDLRLNLGLTFTEAEYDEYNTINNRFAGSPTVSFAGNRLVQTPEYTISFGAEYEFHSAVGSITPRIDVFSSGDLFFLSANSPFDRQEEYTLIDGNISWRSTSDRFSIDLFVRNATDEDVISNDGLQSNTIGSGFGIDNLTYYPPRTYGVRFGVTY